MYKKKSVDPPRYTLIGAGDSETNAVVFVGYCIGVIVL